MSQTIAQSPAAAASTNLTPATTGIRERLVEIALEWQAKFGVAPAVTCAVSELDAAMLVGMTEEEYGRDCINRTAVTRGCDFTYKGVRYQVKANRPSGKPGSFVTLVGKANNFEWDCLIWILYNEKFMIVEAWEWTVNDYRRDLGPVVRLSPAHMRRGRRIR